MAKIRYEQVYNGEWTQPQMTGYLEKCCGCGLIHTHNFKVINSKTGKQVRNVRILIQSFRGNKKK